MDIKHTGIHTLALALLSLAWCHCKQDDKASQAPPAHETLQASIDPAHKIDIEPLLSRFDKETVHIKFDVVLKREKTYLGVNTRKVFAMLVREFNIDTSQYDVTFICKDGYSPVVPLTQLLEGNGYIVVRDVHAKDNWEEDIKAEFSPAYLVWDIPENDHRHSFPYGVAHIQFVEKSARYLLATPRTSAKGPIEGFVIFRDKCIKCHAVNGEGGVLGPELNHPKSVTEYWQPDQLKLFIRDPFAFRANSKMPRITELSDSQIELVVQYLKHMATQKKKTDG